MNDIKMYNFKLHAGRAVLQSVSQAAPNDNIYISSTQYSNSIRTHIDCQDILEQATVLRGSHPWIQWSHANTPDRVRYAHAINSLLDRLTWSRTRMVIGSPFASPSGLTSLVVTVSDMAGSGKRERREMSNQRSYLLIVINFVTRWKVLKLNSERCVRK
jgi:hypothetical protein